MKKNVVKINENAVAGDYYVVAVDKQMSGWGKAKEGKSVVIICCHDDVQAHECEKALSYDKGMKYIKTCYGQKPQIKNAAHIQELDFLKCPRWNKEYMFSFKNNIKENKNMKNNTVKINENTLRQIVAESVKNVLKETTAGQFDGIGADYDGKFSKPKGFSYIGGATEQLDSLRLQLGNLLDHIDTLCKDMSDDEYAFGQMDSSRKTIDILRKIWPLVHEIYELWGYRNS